MCGGCLGHTWIMWSLRGSPSTPATALSGPPSALSLGPRQAQWQTGCQWMELGDGEGIWSRAEIRLEVSVSQVDGLIGRMSACFSRCDSGTQGRWPRCPWRLGGKHTGVSGARCGGGGGRAGRPQPRRVCSPRGGRFSAVTRGWRTVRSSVQDASSST